MKLSNKPLICSVYMLGALLLIGLKYGHTDESPILDIKAGLIKVNANKKLTVYKETTQIPFVPKQVDPDYLWGILIYYSINAENKYCQVVVTVPRSPKNQIIKKVPGLEHDESKIKANLDHISSSHDSVVTERSLCKDIGGVVLRFDEQDKLGEYIFNIYIDDKLYRKIILVGVNKV